LAHDVRTFRAASMRAALERVKRELGPDAVILGTRSVSAAGLGRLIGREHVEVSAAPADTPSPAPRLTLKAGRSATRRVAEPTRAQPGGPGSAQHRRGVPPRPVASADCGGLPALPERVYPYFVQLVQNEVAEELAARLLQSAARGTRAGNAADGSALREALQQCIAELIPTAGPVTLVEGETRRIAFVGPAGAGKTTTLAKVAAHLKLRLGQRVGLLSLDMHRPAANEQLRRYAGAFRVPLECAQTEAAVRDALARQPSPACVLIDTPGIGPRDGERFARLAALLRAAQPDEIHLVVPACTTALAQARIGQTFAPLGVSRLVLTHLDEAVGFGVILNATEKLRWRLSYLAAGQNVPRDLEEACSRRIAELIFPLSS
jgi:flagellar biosynthesis protein FlhF